MKKAEGKSKPRLLRVGDRVIPQGSESVYYVTRVNTDGTQADICLQKTEFERFRVPTSEPTFVK